MNSEIISLIRNGRLLDAAYLIERSNIENHDYHSSDNIFNNLVDKFFERAIHDGISYDMIQSISSLLENPSFKITTDNIAYSTNFLPSCKIFHRMITDHVNRRQTIAGLSVRERTDLLLMIGESCYDDNTIDNFYNYMELVSEAQTDECLQYLIDNFESYFNNCYSNIKSTSSVALRTKEIIKRTLIDRDHVSEDDFNLITIEQGSPVIGEDIKYINIQFALAHFVSTQFNSIQNHSDGFDLFEHPSDFFMFFSKHIRPEKKCINNDFFVACLKDIQTKYKFASISWDNRYFYNVPTDSIKNIIEESIEESMTLFDMKSFSSLHLQFKSPKFSAFGGLHIKMNSTTNYQDQDIIVCHSNSFHEFSLIWHHELTHFVHFQASNSKCFKGETWKRLKNKIYLHDKRNAVFLSLRNAFGGQHDKELLLDLEQLLGNYMHSSPTVFNKYLKKEIEKHSISDSNLAIINDLFQCHRRHSHKKSEQFDLLKRMSVLGGSTHDYLNRDCEVHARLNECLSVGGYLGSYLESYFISDSPTFDLLKDDLIAFNLELSKNLL